MAIAKRKLLRELQLELRLSGDKHMFVEGHSDKRFFEAWLENQGIASRVAVQVVGSIDISSFDLEAVGLPDAERSRAMFLASRNRDLEGVLLCVADRDTGTKVDEYEFGTLAWTDYPALESYIMRPSIFRAMHKVILDERIDLANVLHAQLSIALRRLWLLRCEVPNLPSPNYKKGMIEKGAISSFDPGAASGRTVKSTEVGTEVWPEEDACQFAYGHDIAGLLFGAYSGILKNTLGFSSPEALERAMRASMVGSEELENEPLFIRVKEWATGAL